MATNTYRTATGQQIDMQALALKNEKVRAVGNMNVNARGDVIDSTNKTTSNRSAQVNKSYRKQIGKTVKDTPVVTSKKAANLDADVPEDIIADLDNAPATVKPKVNTKDKEEAPSGGLAAAIASAQEVKKI
jgi:hypothetical protein